MAHQRQELSKSHTRDAKKRGERESGQDKEKGKKREEREKKADESEKGEENEESSDTEDTLSASEGEEEEEEEDFRFAEVHKKKLEKTKRFITIGVVGHPVRLFLFLSLII